MQRFFHRRYLGKDVNAAPFFFNHSLQPSRLTLNTLEAFEVQVLCADVSVGRIVTTAWTNRISCAHEIPLVSSPVVGQTRNHVVRSEEHTSELQSLMRISYAVFCLKKKKHNENTYKN